MVFAWIQPSNVSVDLGFAGSGNCVVYFTFVARCEIRTSRVFGCFRFLPDGFSCGPLFCFDETEDPPPILHKPFFGSDMCVGLVVNDSRTIVLFARTHHA